MKLEITIDEHTFCFKLELSTIGELEVEDWFLESLSDPIIYELGNDRIGIPINGVGEPIDLVDYRPIYLVTEWESIK